eukprot:1728555-Prymnesium_polylepis.1
MPAPTHAFASTRCEKVDETESSPIPTPLIAGPATVPQDGALSARRSIGCRAPPSDASHGLESRWRLTQERAASDPLGEEGGGHIEEDPRERRRRADQPNLRR